MGEKDIDVTKLRQALQELQEIEDDAIVRLVSQAETNDDTDGFLRMVRRLSTRGSTGNSSRASRTMSTNQWMQMNSPLLAKEPIYPMYVMSVKDALEMTELRHHQDLLREGKIICRTKDMIIIFVSHQWLGFSHPDKNMKQFRVLQQALRNLMSGAKVKMCPFTSVVFQQMESHFTDNDIKNLGNAYIWYDYFCVPQLADFMNKAPGASIVQDHRMISDFGKDAGDVDALGKSMGEVQEQQKDAINSIPAYVQTCDHFFVVAPTETHDDTEQVVSLESWGRRGWCRTEMGCHYLSQKAEPVVVCITKEDRIVETFPFAWLHNQPIQGEFSCEGDRKHIKRIMAGLCHERIRYLRQLGQDFEPRFLTAMLPWLAPGSIPREENWNDWLRIYGFDHAQEAGPFGWAPIHFAALEGNMPILEQLVDLGESVNRTTQDGDAPPLGTVDVGMQIPNMTPLMCAAFYIPTGADAVKVSQFLLERKADVNAKAAGGETALHMASAGAATDGILVNYLVDNKADIECTNDARETPLIKASFLCPAGSKFPNVGHVQQLVRRGAKLSGAQSVRPQHPTALKVAAGTGGEDAVKFLLTNRADVNGREDYSTRPTDMAMSAFPEGIRESVVKDSVQHLYGGTPLHWAAYYGNDKTVELLLASGADPSIKNEVGKTAKQVAEMEAQSRVAKTLEKHSTCCKNVMCWYPWSGTKGSL